MKRLLIAGIVGGLITMAWQTISHTALNLHAGAERYTERQADILRFLESQGLEEGHYILPSAPEGTSMEEFQQKMEAHEGKPWARVSYYKAWHVDMGMNLLRGLLTNMFMVSLAAWVISRMESPNGRTVFLTCLSVGMAGFLQFPYASYIWYRNGDIRADLVDAILMWGLCGAWLSWYFRRKPAAGGA